MSAETINLRAYRVIGHMLPDLKPSRHRSSRIRKKLHKRLSTPIMEKTYIPVSPKAQEALEEMAAIFNRSKTNG